MSAIHPTAIVDPRVELGADVSVGPYVVIEGRVRIGAGTKILSHCVLGGPTEIGARCAIGPAAYVGLDPQHLGYRGEETFLVIGDETVVREGAAVHRASKPGAENATRVGSKCFIMGAAHVAHDCRVADSVTLANGVLLAGHVQVGERAFLGGGCGVHQFARVGRLAMIRGNDAVGHDVPPFAAMAYGGLKGYNAIGCKRAGMSRESIHSVRHAYRLIHTHRTVPAAVAAIRASVQQTPEVEELLAFIAASKRGLPASVRYFYSSLARGGDDDGGEQAAGAQG